jgi:hypothetical protein
MFRQLKDPNMEQSGRAANEWLNLTSASDKRRYRYFSPSDPLTKWERRVRNIKEVIDEMRLKELVDAQMNGA